jgi:hypothetical protein
MGAGFSRNWGGMLADDVFQYLLGCNELGDELRRLYRSTIIPFLLDHGSVFDGS